MARDRQDVAAIWVRQLTRRHVLDCFTGLTQRLMQQLRTLALKAHAYAQIKRRGMTGRCNQAPERVFDKLQAD
jgi:hypothetical protein